MRDFLCIPQLAIELCPSPIPLGKQRDAKVFVYPNDSVTIIVSCSAHPYPIDNLSELCLNLERVKNRLQFFDPKFPMQLPPVGDWMVVQWNYNKDGEEISGGNYRVSFRDLSGTLYQLYGKQVSPRSYRARLEKLESPKMSLGEIAASLLASPRLS